jgi:hypothetical protein
MGFAVRAAVEKACSDRFGRGVNLVTAEPRGDVAELRFAMEPAGRQLLALAHEPAPAGELRRRLATSICR